MKNFLFILLCLPALYAGLTSCTPRTTDNPLPPVGDSLPPVKDPCQLHYNGTPPDIEIPVFYQEPVQYYGGVFHPSQPDLCAFVKQSYIDYKLYTLDIKTGKTKILYHTEDNSNIFHLSWNQQGWLAFVCNGFNEAHLMKVKDNGDSLTLIHKAQMFSAPVWNAAGTKIMYQDNQFFWEIAADGSGKKQLFPLTAGTYSIANNALDKCAYVGNKIVVKEFGKDTEYAAYEHPVFSQYGAHGLGWYPDNRHLLVATNHGGVYRFDTETSGLTQIADSCFAQAFLGVSVSADGGQFLLNKNVYHVDSLNRIWMNSKIFCIQNNGKKEKEIKITD